MEILVRTEAGIRSRPPLSRREIGRLVETLLAVESSAREPIGRRAREIRQAGGDAELSILFCGDETIRALNRDYRGKDSATDVLSFAQEEAPGSDGSLLLGDIVLSTETAVRQARAGKRRLAVEVEWLLAHALLHLLGYDDETEQGLNEMVSRGHAVVAALRSAVVQGRPLECGGSPPLSIAGACSRHPPASHDGAIVERQQAAARDSGGKPPHSR